MSIELNRARAWLKSRWQVTVPDDWLSACLEWIHSEHEGMPLAASELHQMVYEQWLVCDLRELGVACLPEALGNQQKVVLTGNYCLQVNSLVDASVPYYGQLTKLRGKDNDNVNVSASTQQSQKPWEVKPTRMIIMTLTDGVQEVQGMELRPIPSINLQMSPGTKVLIRGEVVCRNGMIMLKPENLTTLGGEVEALFEESKLEANLEKALQHNKALDVPQTAKKEFPTVPKQNSRSAPNAPQPRSSTSQWSNQQPQPQPASSTGVSRNVQPEKFVMPTADEWGDDDMDEMFEGLDDTISPPIPTPQRVPHQMIGDEDLEAMLEDDFDDELLLSQDIMIPPQNSTSHGSRSHAPQAAASTSTCSNTAGHPSSAVNLSTSSASSNLSSNKLRASEVNSYKQECSDAQRHSHYGNAAEELSTNRSSLPRIPAWGDNHPRPAGLVSPWKQAVADDHDDSIKPKVAKMEMSSSSSYMSSSSSHMSSSSSYIKPSVNRNAPSAKVPSSSEVCSIQRTVAQEQTTKKCIDLDAYPFTYLSEIQKAWPPPKPIDVTVKAFVATLLDKLEHGNGTAWSLRAKINDGTAVADVILSDEILTSLIGFSAPEGMTLRNVAKQDKSARVKLQTGIKSCQERLINMSAILDIRLDPCQSAPIVLRHRPVTINDLIALHDRNKPQ